MRVLYLQPTGVFGGSSKSLIECYKFLNRWHISGTVITPKGSAVDAFKRSGFEVSEIDGISQFDNTRIGHYRGLRWLILLREVRYLFDSLVILLKLRRQPFDLIHLNEITLLPLGILMKLMTGLPLIVHVRSVQNYANKTLRSKLVNRALAAHADAIICIDKTVARSLAQGLEIAIVHNGMDLTDTKRLRVTHKTKSGVFRVGFVGVLSPMKGIYELVRAIRILRDRGVHIECVIAGENPRSSKGVRSYLLSKFGFSRNVREELSQYLSLHRLEASIKLVGFIEDVSALYRSMDVLCFPSHLDAAGRPVFEAALHGVPSIVAIDSPPDDSVIHEHTGLAIPGPEPKNIADALERLVNNSSFCRDLGRNARQWAVSQFDAASSAKLIRQIYRDLIHPKLES